MDGSLRRSKTIGFRLSPEEYESIENLCAAQGVGGLRSEIRSPCPEEYLSRELAARQGSDSL